MWNTVAGSYVAALDKIEVVIPGLVNVALVGECKRYNTSGIRKE
jgi:hypothetical protein